jgi:hypothetical protein
MQTHSNRPGTVCGRIAVAAVLCCVWLTAGAARVGVVSNAFSSETAADFNARVAGHTFSAIDVTLIPSTATLTANFDVLLVFEDSTFTDSVTVGNRVAAFAQTGRAVVLGTFYDQDRSDAAPALMPHGWGALESIDPNTTDGKGTGYAPRTLNAASLLAHPLTQGITSLEAREFAGGNQAKAGTIVAAYWQESNARGLPDPAIAYRVTGPACVIHIAIAPNYPTVGVPGVDFAGDFHAVWKNAFDFAAAGCAVATEDPGVPGVPGVPSVPGAHAIPTLSSYALALMALLLAALGARAFRRRCR